MVEREKVKITELRKATIDIPKHHFGIFEQVKSKIQHSIPGLEIEISDWKWHSGGCWHDSGATGYSYCDVTFSHKIPGRAEEAMNLLEEAIHYLSDNDGIQI